MTDTEMAKKFFSEGMEEFVDNNYGKSIESLTHAIEANPDFKLAYVSRGAAYMRMERMQEALDDFNKAIELAPSYARAYHLRGLATEKMGDREKAIHDFDRAIELDPEYGAAYYSRATAHTKMGHEDLAVEDIEMVTHLTEVEIEKFANDSNIWRSRQLHREWMEFSGEPD